MTPAPVENELEKLKLKAKELDSKKSDCAKELEKLKSLRDMLSAAGNSQHLKKLIEVRWKTV